MTTEVFVGGYMTNDDIDSGIEEGQVEIDNSVKSLLGKSPGKNSWASSSPEKPLKARRNTLPSEKPPKAKKKLFDNEVDNTVKDNLNNKSEEALEKVSEISKNLNNDIYNKLDEIGKIYKEMYKQHKDTENNKVKKNLNFILEGTGLGATIFAILELCEEKNSARLIKYAAINVIAILVVFGCEDSPKILNPSAKMSDAIIDEKAKTQIT